MSESGDRWREWFDRVGDAADMEVINATANLVIAECDIHTAQLVAVVRGILAEPHGCSLCDSGVPRNKEKGCQPDCPYEVARAAINKAP